MRYYYGGIWKNTENVFEIRAYSEFFVRSKNNKRLGIEIDQELRCNPHYIADGEGRSANGQILYLIRKRIREFETENSEIKKAHEDASGMCRRISRSPAKQFVYFSAIN